MEENQPAPIENNTETPKQIQEPQSDNQSSLPRRLRLNLNNTNSLVHEGNEIIIPNTTRTFSPNVISFQYKNTNPVKLNFTQKTTIKDAKHFLAPRFHILPDCLILKYNKVLEDEILLKDIQIPFSKNITIEIDNKDSVDNEDSNEYLFMLQHEAYKFSFGKEATVAQAKEKLIEFADSATTQMHLKFNGVRLNDNLKLSELKYEQGDCIVAETILMRQDQFRTTKRLNTSHNQRSRSIQKM